MEPQEEDEEIIDIANKHQDHTQIIKGKRTKRQRPLSPIPFLIAAPIHPQSSADSSRAGSTEDIPVVSAAATITEEEKDMANCLILLAQGRSRPEESPRQRQSPLGQDNQVVVFKVSSGRRHTTPSIATTAVASYKVGQDVYECKTCNRTFPSFQALGGHRTSHKKSKLAAANNETKAPHVVASPSWSDEEARQFKSINSIPPPYLSLQLLDTNKKHNNNNKLHECSVCGAEFTSGQALGGHMRRHRGTVTTATATPAANTALSLSPMAALEVQEEAKKPILGGGGGERWLSLDLNLPAVAVAAAAGEDQHHRNGESKLALSSKQKNKEQGELPKQSHLVFSTPTLVDCHY